MKNSTPLAGWSFWAWGTGHGEEVTNALCPKRLSLSTHSWDGVSRRFQ
ncbi:MAG: hypothetical protein V7L23_27720 [Nostoc sp.]